VVGLALYVLNRFVVKPNLHHYSPFFHGHFDDSLTVPVALPLFLFVYRLIGFRPDDEPPRWWEVALHLVVWIVFFKVSGPAIFHHGVADPIDSWCMTAGGLVSLLFWQAWAWRRRAEMNLRHH